MTFSDEELRETIIDCVIEPALTVMVKVLFKSLAKNVKKMYESIRAKVYSRKWTNVSLRFAISDAREQRMSDDMVLIMKICRHLSNKLGSIASEKRLLASVGSFAELPLGTINCDGMSFVFTCYGSGVLYYSMTIFAPKGQDKLISDFINEAHNEYKLLNSSDVLMYMSAGNYVVYPGACGIVKRPLVSNELAERLDKLIVTHKKTGRSSVLLHGPVGSGKTTICRWISEQLSVPMCIVYLSKIKSIEELMNVLHKRIITTDESEKYLYDNKLLVFEDIDNDTGSVISGNEGMSNKEITFAQIINALDGIVSLKKCMCIFTTNNHNLLSSTFIRPGRVTDSIHVPYLSVSDVKKILGVDIDSPMSLGELMSE